MKFVEIPRFTEFSPAIVELTLDTQTTAFIADVAARDGISFDVAAHSVLLCGIDCLRGFAPESEGGHAE